jgi:hypothetical protein
MAPTLSGRGYWLLASDGGTFAFGDAPFVGAAADSTAPAAVALAASPSGRGYWVTRTDGSVRSFGDAPFLGAAASAGLQRPIVGMAG